MTLKWDCAECGHRWKDKDENQYEECLNCQSKYIESDKE